MGTMRGGDTVFKRGSLATCSRLMRSFSRSAGLGVGRKAPGVPLPPGNPVDPFQLRRVHRAGSLTSKLESRACDTRNKDIVG